MIGLAGFGKPQARQAHPVSNPMIHQKIHSRKLTAEPHIAAFNLERNLIGGKHSLDPFREQCHGQVMQSAWPGAGFWVRWPRS
jgi:hypothetical protein